MFQVNRKSGALVTGEVSLRRSGAGNRRNGMLGWSEQTCASHVKRERDASAGSPQVVAKRWNVGRREGGRDPSGRSDAEDAFKRAGRTDSVRRGRLMCWNNRAQQFRNLRGDQTLEEGDGRVIDINSPAAHSCRDASTSREAT